MKALSLTQPYGGLIHGGFKTIETRTWKTNYRGPILICSTKQKVLDDEGNAIEPTGKALCIVDILGCRPMVPGDETAACIAYREDLYSWPLGNLRLIKPFPVKGQLNIFNVDVEIEDIVK